MSPEEELKELRDLAQEKFRPYNIDPSDYYWHSPGFCPVCKVVDVGKTGVIVHESSCYWFKKGIKHVQGDLVGKKSGEYERYKCYHWNPVPMKMLEEQND